MQNLESNFIFPDNKVGHMELDYPDGNYTIDNNKSWIITIQDKKLVKLQRGEVNGVPYCVFTYDYENMITYREFPANGVEKHVFNSEEIRKNGMYERLVKDLLNTTMQLEGKVDNIKVDDNNGLLIATLNNGEQIEWNMNKNDKK